MSLLHNDIDNNEIRVITSESRQKDTGISRRRLISAILIGAAVLLIAALTILWLVTDSKDDADETIAAVEVPEAEAPVIVEPVAEPVDAPAYTSVRDTVVGGIGLRFLTPHNARPVLEIGSGAMDDSTAVLAAQASDIRADNGEIAGAYVVAGELVARGQRKTGFCAIVDGQISIGAADATPLFEQAMNSGGYFFRQYPLVVGGQPVENKPKGRAVRKALAETGGSVSVVVSADRLTFGEFSQALSDAGVRNAIYLVGSSSFGSYTDAEGVRTVSRRMAGREPENINFIVWR